MFFLIELFLLLLLIAGLSLRDFFINFCRLFLDYRAKLVWRAFLGFGKVPFSFGLSSLGSILSHLPTYLFPWK
jgi:hypothetical protein